MLRFRRFDPGPCDFPRPGVPALPPLTWRQVVGAATVAEPELRHYSRGRYALHAAFALAGVGPQGALLAPAYHCRTMLDGAIRLGAEVGLYPLTPDLQPDAAGLERTASACSMRPVALLFTHYFGLPRDIGWVAAWCRRNGIALIEDCSHALAPRLSGPDDGAGAAGLGAMGQTGRYAISSPYKFHPCPDGGLLWSPEGAALPVEQPASRGLRAEAGGAWHALGQFLARPPAPSPATVDAELQTLASQNAHLGRDWVEGEEGPGISGEYVRAHEGLGGLAVSRWIRRHTDAPELLQRRLRRYREWVDAVRDLPGCRALFAELPPGSTPYMFPLLVDDPMQRFYPLKRIGLPLWRWDDMAISDCAVSTRYRQGLFHLPCHQALDDEQMRWMIAALSRVMRN